MHFAFCTRRAFTLIELLVAIGLMAILLIMIATIFYQATQSFRMARAAIEIHQNARAVLNALEKDLTAAEFCTYGTGVQGYFALTPGPVDPATGLYSVPPNSPAPLAANGAPIALDTLTFTTLAPQPGALYAAPEAVLQLALVRYALQWDGGSATLQGTRVARPTFTLVKRVRFPSTSNPNLNMGSPIVGGPSPLLLTISSDAFNNQFVANPSGTPSNYPYNPNTPNYPSSYNANLPVNQLTGEIILDANSTWVEYAQPEPQAFKVLSMSISLFCRAPLVNGTLQPLQVFTYGGLCTGTGSATTLVDATTGRPNALLFYPPPPSPPPVVPPFPLPNGASVRLVAGTGAPATIFPVSSDNGGAIAPYTITINPSVNPPGWTLPFPAAWTQYQIIPNTPNITVPTWLQRTNDPNFGTNPFLGMVTAPPALVEITLELTDQRATRSFSFTERFYIPASER